MEFPRRPVVRLWWIPSDLRLADAVDSVLTSQEAERARTFRREEDQVRSRIGAALLRLAVAAEDGRSPREVSVEHRCTTCGGAHGAPLSTGLHLSLAHAGAWVVAASCRTAPVGVDVEQVATLENDWSELRAQVLAPTEHAGSPRDLLRLWVAKEAFLKATGQGLTVDPREVSVRAGRARRGDDHAVLVTPSERPEHESVVAVLGSDAADILETDAYHLLQAAIRTPDRPFTGSR